MSGIDASGVGTYFEIVAWITGVILVLGIAVGVAILRYNGIDREQRRQLYAIRPQLFDVSPVSLSASAATGFSDVEPQVRGLLSGSKRDFSPPTVRDAGRTLIATIRAAIPDAPRLAVRGASEGVVILAIGVALWTGPLLWAAVTDPETVALVELGRDVIAVLPGAETVAAIGLTVGVLAGTVLTTLWVPIGLVLIIGAILLAEVDRRTAEDLSVTLFPDRRRFVAFLVGVPLVSYAFGATLYAIAAARGEVHLGIMAGVYGTAMLLTGAAIYGAFALRRALVARQSIPTENTRVVAVYLLVRKAFGVLAVLALPVVIWKLSHAIVAFGRWGLTRPLLAGALVFVSLIAVFLGGWFVFATEVRSIFAAIGRWLRSRTLRAWLFSRGIPVTAMILAFLTAWVFGLQTTVGPVPVLDQLLGLYPAVIAAVVIGTLVRVITLLWRRAKYQFVSFDDGGGQSTVVLDVYPPIEDADGDELYVVSVGGVKHAHRDVDELVSDIRTACNGLFETASLPMTLSRYYWKDLEFGTVDLDQVHRECRGDVRSRMLATVREHNRVEESVIDEELMQKYPEGLVERERAQVLARGDLIRRDGMYVYNE